MSSSSLVFLLLFSLDNDDNDDDDADVYLTTTPTAQWDLNEGKHLYSLEAGDTINSLVFSPNRYWLCAATASSIKIFDLESKSLVDELRPDFQLSPKAREPEATSLAWSADGSYVSWLPTAPCALY